MGTIPNFYTVLGLDPNLSTTITEAEIKKAYRILSKKHHPDVGGDPIKFQEVNKAYEVLMDPQSRARYDRGDWTHSDSEMEFQNEVLNTVVKVLNAAIEQEVAEFKAFVTDLHTSNKKRLEREINTALAKISKLEAFKKRIDTLDSDHLALVLIGNKIKYEQETVDMARRAIEILQAAVDLLMTFKIRDLVRIEGRHPADLDLNSMREVMETLFRQRRGQRSDED